MRLTLSNKHNCDNIESEWQDNQPRDVKGYSTARWRRHSLVHLCEDHEDRNTEHIQSYRTKLINQELQRGKASLKLFKYLFKCLIKSKSWYDETTAVGHPPVITVDGFDDSGGLRMVCESEVWYPEPVLDSETTETHRNADRFSVKHTVTVYERDSKIHCRVKLRHHMLETQIVTKTPVLISFVAVLSGFAGILIAVFVHKNRSEILVILYILSKICKAAWG
uniref:Uncharacterized protein n=1 Tax=Sinocyclocheilus grahami TaxID=75366 RepID=A0A672NH26_SINGR